MISVEAKKRKDKCMTRIFVAGAAFAVILLIAFVLYVVIDGVGGMTSKMLSFGPQGLGNMFFNTIYLVFLLSLPVRSRGFRQVFSWLNTRRKAA